MSRPQRLVRREPRPARRRPHRARGETVTLLGRNGVGKTTTLRAIMGIVRKRTGTLRFDGQDLMRLPLHRTAHAGLGFVPEERGIFSTLDVRRT